jgi:hypothetical protein
MSRRNQKGNGPPKGRSTKQETKWQLTFDLLLFHLESPALGLDRLLKVQDRGALLLEGPALVVVRDAEGDQLPVEPRELIVALLRRRPRLLESSMLPLERRSGISEGRPLLLELVLGPLVGGAFPLELLLCRGDSSCLGGEGGLQLFGLLGPLLGFPRPLLSPPLLGLRL